MTRITLRWIPSLLLSLIHSDKGRALSSGASSTKLRLMTYNIQAWRDVDHICNFDRIVKTVQRTKPDILCLNEVLHPFARPAMDSQEVFDYYKRVQRREGRHSLIPDSFFPEDEAQTFLHRLAKETGLTNMGFCGTVDDSNFGKGSEFGNALLTSLSIEEARHCLLTTEPGDIDLGNQPRDFVDPRAFSAYKIEIPHADASIGVGVVHLDHKSEELRDKQIRRGIRETSGLLNSVPHLVCGDMNTLQKSDCDDQTWQGILDLYDERGWVAPPAESLVLNSLADLGFVDTFYIRDETSKAAEYPDPTAWSDTPLMRIDHVYKREAAENSPASIQVIDHRRDDSDASDHFPVVVDIEVSQTRS